MDDETAFSRRRFFDEGCKRELAPDDVRLVVWRFVLPKLERELPGNRSITVNTALALIARHNLPPPDWLAAEMLVRFPIMKRANAVDFELASVLFEAVEATDKSDAALNLIADKHNISLTKLKRITKEFREEIARLEGGVD